MYTLRKLNLIDAENLSHFLFQLDTECDYLLYDPNERNYAVIAVEKYIEKILSHKKSTIFIAVNNSNQIVGFIIGEVSSLKRTSHTMKIVIGALKFTHGSGIGRKLSQAMLIHAKSVGILRIEANVVVINKLSINLCRKMGMSIEGVKRKAIKINGKYLDEYMLGLCLF